MTRILTYAMFLMMTASLVLPAASAREILPDICANVFCPPTTQESSSGFYCYDIGGSWSIGPVKIVQRSSCDYDVTIDG